MFSNSIDLVHQILHVDDAILVKRLSSQDILQGNLLLIDFAITMLIDQFIYRLQIW